MPPLVEREYIDSDSDDEEDNDLEEGEAGYTASFNGNTWIADSGASTHTGNVGESLIDETEIDEAIRVGYGNEAGALKKGSLQLTLVQVNGDTMDVVLHDYKYSPELGVCLFSITKALEKGWSVTNDGLTIKLRKNGQEIRFDRKTKTRDGVLCGVELLPRIENSYMGRDNDDASACWDINSFHKIFGHASEEIMRETAKSFCWKLTGKFESCDDCQVSNVKQARTKKMSENSSTIPGERLFLDTSKVAGHKSLGGASVWLGVVDDATGFMWSRLMNKKSDTADTALQLLQEINDSGKEIRYIRCDNAGENKVLKEKCGKSPKEWLRKIKFEFTAINSPQMNGKVEIKFAVVTRRVKSILNGAKLSKELRSVLWGEAIMRCTDFENILKSRAYERPGISGNF